MSVKDFGAKGDGVTDDTTAIQAALDTARNVYFPIGIYQVSSTLTFSAMNNTAAAGRTIRGESMGDSTFRHGSVIRLTGGNDGFKCTDSLPFVTFRDLAIVGGETSGVGIWFTGTLAMSLFENLQIYAGKQAIYAPHDGAPYGRPFSTTFLNVHGSSWTASVFEVAGGPGTNFIGSYVHNFPAREGVAGFRVYKSANFYGCNSVDAGGTAAIIGQYTAAGDATTTDYDVSFTGCNFEAFTIAGVELRGRGTASFRDSTFVGAGAYKASIIQHSPATSTLPIVIERCTFQNSTAYFQNFAAAEWQRNRYYARGARVQAGASIYEVTTAGVSDPAAGFPGGATDIVDGTAVWKYVAPGPSARTKRAEFYVQDGGQPNLVVYNTPSLGVQPQVDFKGTDIIDVGGSAGIHNVDGVRAWPHESGKVLAGPIILNGPVLNPIAVHGEYVVLGNGTAGTVGAAGGASPLPGAPLGYLIANVNGTTVKIPYFSN